MVRADEATLAPDGAAWSSASYAKPLLINARGDYAETPHQPAAT